MMKGGVHQGSFAVTAQTWPLSLFNTIILTVGPVGEDFGVLATRDGILS